MKKNFKNVLEIRGGRGVNLKKSWRITEKKNTFQYFFITLSVKKVSLDRKYVNGGLLSCYS